MQLILILTCGLGATSPGSSAQLKYPLPRLAGQGIMLSRQAGDCHPVVQGVSCELNRRSVRNRITDIERQLHVVEATEK